MHPTYKSVGLLLKSLRLEKRMTGIELGRMSGISQSKISKIESGIPPISPAHLEKLFHILKPSPTIRQQVSDLLFSSKEIVPRRLAFPVNNINFSIIEEPATTHRVVAVTSIPALLQTIPYYRAMHGEPDGDAIEQNISELLRRQDKLWSLGKQHHIIIMESALYLHLTAKDEHISQLDRVERCLGHQTPKVGIMPTTAGTGNVILCNFNILDEEWLLRELGTDDIVDQDAELIRKYMYLFDIISSRAAYGKDAQTLLTSAKDYVLQNWD